MSLQVRAGFDGSLIQMSSASECHNTAAEKRTIVWRISDLDDLSHDSEARVAWLHGRTTCLLVVFGNFEDDDDKTSVAKTRVED